MGTGGSFIERSYADIVHNIDEDIKKPAKKRKSADEIVSDVISMGGLKLINNEGKEAAT